MRNENLVKTLEDFIASPEFEDAVISSTKAGWGGSGYSVEIFEDGTWRVLWDNSIGNLYRSEGMILGIPKATDSDDANDDIDVSWEIDDLAKALQDKLYEHFDQE